jgi:acyl-CoA synthetase (AMP-forming)/AMP-acid ligase II
MSDHRKTHYSLKISKRTLPETLDDIAKETPGRRYATISVTANVTDGFRDVSFMDIANGANRIAFQLEKLFGRSNEFETITYLGIPDLRYVMVIFGAIKCGFKVSSLNDEIIVHLIDYTT